MILSAIFQLLKLIIFSLLTFYFPSFCLWPAGDCFDGNPAAIRTKVQGKNHLVSVFFTHVTKPPSLEKGDWAVCFYGGHKTGSHRTPAFFRLAIVATAAFLHRFFQLVDEQLNPFQNIFCGL